MQINVTGICDVGLISPEYGEMYFNYTSDIFCLMVRIFHLMLVLLYI
jgi:hypothetical protein